MASGEVETSNGAGVVRGAAERLPPEMYLRDSPLTQVNGTLRAFAAEATRAAESLDSVHRLMAALHEACPIIPSRRTPPARRSKLSRSGADARAISPNVHRLRAMARDSSALRGGYRVGDETGEAGAHEWAEAHPGFGWVAFDASAPVCPDDRYVRVAIGFDGQDGAMSDHLIAAAKRRSKPPSASSRRARKARHDGNSSRVLSAELRWPCQHEWGRTGADQPLVRRRCSPPDPDGRANRASGKIALRFELSIP